MKKHKKYMQKYKNNFEIKGVEALINNVKFKFIGEKLFGEFNIPIY